MEILLLLNPFWKRREGHSTEVIKNGDNLSIKLHHALSHNDSMRLLSAFDSFEQTALPKKSHINSAFIQKPGTPFLTKPIYLAPVLEYLIAEIQELVGNGAWDDRKTGIRLHHLQLTVSNDKELNKQLGSVTIAQGRVFPNIQAVPAQENCTSQQGLSLQVKDQKKCVPLYMLTAPNVLRFENDENVVLEAHELNADLEVDITLQFFPKNDDIICRKHETLLSNKGYLSLPVKIPRDRIPKETVLPKYVVLEAKSALFNLERIILISYQIGHIFIQTDKPIYTPTQTVFYRLLTVNTELKPTKRTVLVDFVNPHDVIMKRDEVFAKDDTGMTGSTFKIPEIVNIGVWKIAASYKEASHINYTTEFEVKEYVLPSFEVIVESEKHFFYIDDIKLDVSITARFTYGKPVEGRAFVLFGIMKDGEKINIPSSLKSVAITDGQGHTSLTSGALKTSFPNIQELVGCSIYITASVITHTGSDMVEAEKSGIKIVTSPYTILFTKTSKYYKPGMPFDLMVYVTNPDGSPANGVPVTANNDQSHSKTQLDGVARLTINTVGQPQNLPVKVETTVANTPKSRQASASMVAEPYKTQYGSTNYLHIGIQPVELSPGNNLVVNLNLRNDNTGTQNKIKYFTYMLISKGKILTVGRQPRESGQIVVNMLIPITPNLIPSFRLLVYYYLPKDAQTEIVADSIWVDVKDTCMGKLIVSAANKHDENKIYAPGKQFQLKLTGDSGATVGLVAVDKAVFILNKKNKLTQRKIWDVVEKNDIGCSPGSGRDVFGVFSDAGLTFITTTDIKTATRTELKCKQPMIRKRRSTSLMDVKAAKLHQYTKLPRKCCRDGMKVNPMGFSCNKRAKRILFGQECKAAFLDCCNHITEFKIQRKKTEMTLARSDDDDYYSPYEDIISRSDFPESWLWILKTLPTDPEGRDVTQKVSGYLKDSITTWEIQAVSVSSEKGICVAQPYELTVQKDFFIDLRLPFSVVRNEQVEIRAILYNYDEDDIRVRVEFPYKENLCSGAKQTQKFRKEVTVPGKGSVAVPYVIVPLTIGEIDIEVKASVYDRLVTDGVRKSLLVILILDANFSIGIESLKQNIGLFGIGKFCQKGKKLIYCNLTSWIPKAHYEIKFVTKPRNGILGQVIQSLGKQQVFKINGTVPDDIVPNTDPLSFISVQGDILAQTIENVIDGTKLKHLIRVPTGCGEQNMASITPVVIVTKFLDKTLQWERVGMDQRDIALKNIKKGYAQQLGYRKEDGSFAAFISRTSSSWLTAYVVKVFAMSYNLGMIEPKILCGAAKWLILNKQQPDGRFKEDGPVVHGEMIGGVHGSESDTSLTAFVLIAMLEAKSICSIYIESIEGSIRKAGDYLENHIGNLKRTYAVAITTYALSLMQINKLDILMRFASPDQSYWAEAGNVNSLYTIEATGYALLALVQLKKFEQARRPVKWLSLRSEYGGGFASTQATMIALQGLANYQAAVPSIQEIDLDVVVSISGRQIPIVWRFDSSNQYVAKSARMSALNKVEVKVNGEGQGTMKVLTSYHAQLSKHVKECKKFNLQVTVREVPEALRPDGAQNSLLINVCARYLGDSDSSMVIADISMLTGFSPDMQDLGSLKNGVEGYISRFELDKALSTQGSLIVYLDSVSHTEDTCFGFKVHQFFKVGLIQPASAKIYEYYDTVNSCTKFYNVIDGSGMLNKICQGDVCRCAEGSCISVKTPDQHISYSQHEEKACRPGTDYGSDDVVNGQFRELITHANCGGTFEVDLKKAYLIMGQGSDLWGEDKRINYLIGDGTWVEFWPNEAECQERRYSRHCEILEEFSEALMVNGCST
ncbi:complement C3-like [Carcharodon carcharias]|uniref:complement C3-like n=1 Tax=Carcharodon carcharias TaxID=13397 RepID=UPI001B7F7139|nr:complement C3-like [Carcharodon carcharias]